MIKNENGFTYPLTTAILLLITFLLTLQLELYLNEKRILAEESALLEQEYYFYTSLHQVEERLQTEELATNGIFTFQNGHVAYHTEKMSVNQVKVTYKLYLKKEYELTAYSYYDEEMQSMTKWIEPN
ncbi:competence type IV pilus minor pilin ComGG [Cytobacillus gottheilii]|uniref:competence type IV pilus minor pilin ComGG n=1 Tax=Cytobacillus gottheilii TaxID=859144 RepID=UPI0015949CEC|nr:competence type IV pilus minor pilin ComGG [Cytobacillus gottheilii]